MVRKVSVVICSLVLICAICTTAQASTHTVYDNSTISTTYIQYFKDILQGVPTGTDYVAFRSGQNSYTLVTFGGYSSYGNYIVAGNKKNITEYRFYTESESYNSNYKYSVKKLDSFEIDVTDKIIYCTLDGYPTLYDERSLTYNDIQTTLFGFIIIAFYISRIFSSSKRRSC